MGRIFITGSADGLGRAAAQSLISDGHEVIVHVRSAERLAAVTDLVDKGASAVLGDLADVDQTRAVADQVNELGRVDAVIHNAGIYSGPHIMPVNVVAPYLLTALIRRPERLVYLSSGMHRGGREVLAGMDWSGSRTTGSYSDSKLFVTTLAADGPTWRVWTGADSAPPARTRTASCSSPPLPLLSPASGQMCAATPSIPAGCPPGWAGPVLPTTSDSDT
jgi:nucleoside-diphosphate-sugar epimerase